MDSFLNDSLQKSGELQVTLVRSDFALSERYCAGLVTAVSLVLLPPRPHPHISQQVVLSCSLGARHTFYLKRQQTELPAASCAALPVFLSFLLPHWGL